MNLYALLLLGAFIITGFLFTYILAQKGNGLVNLSYLLMAGLLEIWIAGDFIVSTKFFMPHNLTILKVLSFSWLFIGVFYIHFLYVLLNRKKNLLYYTLLVCAVFLSFAAVFTNWIYTGVQASSWGIIEKRGFLYEPAGYLLVVFPIIYSSVVLLREAFKTSDSLKKKQMFILATGSILSIVVGIITDIIFPRLFFGFMITGSFQQRFYLFLCTVR